MTGFGLIEKVHNRINHITNGTIRAPKNLPFAHKLLYIHDRLVELIDEHSPSHLAMEQSFVSTNAKSSLKLGQARGAVLIAAAKNKVPIYEYTPTEVKLSLAGYGQADKEQVQEMVKLRLKISEIEAIDSSDALAVAICHSQSLALRKLMR